MIKRFILNIPPSFNFETPSPNLTEIFLASLCGKSDRGLVSYRLPSSSVVCHHSRMKRLLPILLTLVVLLFNPTEGWSADFRKGLDAAQRGDYATALREWKPLAEQGDASAQLNLGVMYHNGKGVPKDDREAVKWFRLAAEQGNAPAQSLLGLMYDEEEGVPKDDKEAVKWYRLAAEQGLADAQFNLGFMYGKGEGVPKDYVEAYKWGNLAAANGNEKGAKLRDMLEKEMTPSQIEKAQDLSRECVKKNYKGC